jgi:hypothetical protein
MADIDQIIVKTDTTTIPGHTLTEPTAILDRRLAIRRAASDYMLLVEDSVGRSTMTAGRIALDKAAELLLNRPFDDNRPPFLWWAESTQGWMYLGYLCLAKTEPKGFTEEHAATLLMAHSDAKEAVLRLWGLRRPLDRPDGTNAAQGSQTPAATPPENSQPTQPATSSAT